MRPAELRLPPIPVFVIRICMQWRKIILKGKSMHKTQIATYKRRVRDYAGARLATTISEAWARLPMLDTVSLINTHEAWLRSKQKLDYITHFASLTGLANLQSLRTRIDYLLTF